MKVNKLMLRVIGLLNPVIKGNIEMYYKQEYGYRYDSSKFEKGLQIVPPAYETGFRSLANTFYKTKRV